MRAFASPTRSALNTSQWLVRGFSLLELCVVMAIVIITSVIAVPVVNSTLNAYVVNSAVTSLTGAVQTTRYQAISDGYPFALVVTKSTSSYQVQSDPGRTGTFANVGHVIPFSSNKNLLGQNTTLVFRPGGAVCLNTTLACVCQTNAAGACQMTVTYKNNPQEVITVSPYGQTTVVP